MCYSITTYLVSIQTTVSKEIRGVATSVNMFMRITGQAVGAALYGAVLNLGLAGRLTNGSGELNRLLDPALREATPADELMRLAGAMDASLRNVYLLGALLSLLVLLLAWGFPRGQGPASEEKSA